MNDIQRLAFNVRKQRERRGWTQEQLALVADTTQKTVSKVENAERDCMQIATVQKFARAFGLDWKRLFDDPPKTKKGD